MDHADCGRAFTDRRRDTLARTMTRVPGREHTRHARFEREGVASERPALRPFAFREEIAPCENESLCVALQEVGYHIRSRRGADENEHCRRRDLTRFLRLHVRESDRFEAD